MNEFLRYAWIPVVLGLIWIGFVIRKKSVRVQRKTDRRLAGTLPSDPDKKKKIKENKLLVSMNRTTERLNRWRKQKSILYPFIFLTIYALILLILYLYFPLVWEPIPENGLLFFLFVPLVILIPVGLHKMFGKHSLVPYTAAIILLGLIGYQTFRIYRASHLAVVLRTETLATPTLPSPPKPVSAPPVAPPPRELRTETLWAPSCADKDGLMLPHLGPNTDIQFEAPVRIAYLLKGCDNPLYKDLQKKEEMDIPKGYIWIKAWSQTCNPVRVNIIYK